MKRKNKKDEVKIEMSVKSSTGTPETPEEMVNAYGTYNIQPTNNTENDFPAIAQGTPKYMAERPLEFFRDEDDDNPASDMSGKHCL